MKLLDLSVGDFWALGVMPFVYGTGITLTTAVFAIVYLSNSG